MLQLASQFELDSFFETLTVKTSYVYVARGTCADCTQEQTQAGSTHHLTDQAFLAFLFGAVSFEGIVFVDGGLSNLVNGFTICLFFKM